jgi:Putative peptidoglycan binding domain
MKKFTSLLIVCSLTLAGAALAQQPEEQQSPSKGKHGAGKAHAGAQAETNAAKPESATPKTQGGRKQRGASNEPGASGTSGATPNERGAGKGRKGRANQGSATAPQTETNVSGQPGATVAPNDNQQQQTQQGGKKGRNGRNARGANAKTSPNTTPVTEASPNGTAAAAAATGAVQSGTQANQANNANAAVGRGGKKKADPQQVQQIKAQHANFRAQPKPQQVPAVTFNQSYRIQGSERWQGPQYEVFRAYHPERHDERWYRSHYPRVELIGGGYYYWNNGYWYPAWGYSPSAEYYAYDGPIYVGHRAEPPDRVIADVQAVLQQMGYYRGEVDGLLGPLTREALTAYQADQGLTTTAAIDEPTLDSLGMG